MIHRNLKFVPWQILLNEPICSISTPLLAIIVSAGVECQHQISAFSTTSVTLTPQWMNQMKDVTKISLSVEEKRIGFVCLHTL